MSNLIHWIESLITESARFAVSRDLPDYCDLQTLIRLTDDDRIRQPELTAPYILVTDEADYCSVFDVAGSFCDTDEAAPRRRRSPGPVACTHDRHPQRALAPAGA